MRDLEREKRECLEKLEVETETPLTSTKLRTMLRGREVEKWKSLPFKGRGVALFQESAATNGKLTIKGGLSSGEFTESIKLVTNSVSVRANPGRGREGYQCRRCPVSETSNVIAETLPHVLGQCSFGEKLRLERHHHIRKLLAAALKDKGWTVFEEVTCEEQNGGSRRVDIFAFDQAKKKGVILDPTVRFEEDSDQPARVDAEKKLIYEPTIPYFRERYGVERIEVVGMLFGARGSIPLKVRDSFKTLNLPLSLLGIIAQDTLRRSIFLLRHHLYSPVGQGEL